MYNKDKFFRFLKKAALKTIPGLFVFITLFVFAPTEMYLTNTSEFWFSLNQILPALLAIGAGIAAVLTVILILVPEKPSEFLGTLIIALTAMLYIQGNYLSINYGTLNGEAIDWSSFSDKYLLNGILWVLVFAAVMFLHFRFKDRLGSIARVVACIIMGTQILSLTIIALTADTTENSSEVKQYFSKDNEFTVSSNRNTIVLLLDCFDSGLFSNLYREYPELIEETFGDFTFYGNMVGGATRTKYAIPYLFSGFTNIREQSYPQYLEEVYQKSPIFRELRSGDYSTGLYSEKTLFYLSQNEAIDNIRSGSSEVLSRWALAKDYMHLIAFRYSPGVLNRCFWMYSGDFDKWKTTGQTANGEYVIDDVCFYRELADPGLSVGTDKPCFRFYHLNGAHAPYEMNENCEKVDYTEGNEEAQALGSIRIVAEYMRQLRQLGLYEDAAIIVMADHGYGKYSAVEIAPLFLVKEPNHHGFEISDLALSYRSFPEILSKLLRGEEVDFPAFEESNRFFYLETEDSKAINIIEYHVQGDVRDKTAVSETGVVYHGNSLTLTQDYRLGDEISFAEDDTARAYIVSGFSMNEGAFTWTSGNRAEMQFELDRIPTNLVLKMKTRASQGAQHVSLFVNDQPLLSYTANGKEENEFLIPGSMISSKTLKLAFEFPDAFSPASIGKSNDSRLLALAFQSMMLTDQFEINKYRYSPGQEILFTSKSDGRKYFCYGISYLEDDFAWSLGNSSRIQLYLGDNAKDLTADICSQNIYHGNQRLIVRADGQTLFDETVTKADPEISFGIPASCIHDGLLILNLEYPDATSPKSDGRSNDDRILAVAFRSITVAEKAS